MVRVYSIFVFSILCPIIFHACNSNTSDSERSKATLKNTQSQSNPTRISDPKVPIRDISTVGMLIQCKSLSDVPEEGTTNVFQRTFHIGDDVYIDGRDFHDMTTAMNLDICRDPTDQKVPVFSLPHGFCVHLIAFREYWAGEYVQILTPKGDKGWIRAYEISNTKTKAIGRLLLNDRFPPTYLTK